MSDVPQGWAATTLAEIAIPTRPRVSPGELPHLPFVGMEHIEAHSMRILGTVPAVEMKSSAVHFQSGDVLYGRLRPYLNKVHLAEAEGLCSAEFIVFPGDTPLGSRWLAYLLNSAQFVVFASHLPTGDRPRVDFDQIGTYRVLLPPRPEQDRIVAEIDKQLTRLDAAVAALKRVQANLKRYRASVLKAACEGRLVPTEAELASKEGRSYEPADLLLTRILQERHARWEADQLAKMLAAGKPPKDDSWKRKYKEPDPPETTSLPVLPEGWTWASLEALTSAARPICYGILMPKENVPRGVLYVKVKDMKGDRIDVNALHRTAPEIAAAYERASLRSGDLLLAIRGTYGRVAQVPPELDGGNITQDTVRLDVSLPLEKRYIATCLRAPDVQLYFKRVARGVAVKGVNVADVRTAPIALPPFQEQCRIADAVEQQLSTINENEIEVEHSLARANRLRHSILKRAFEGKLVPQDPNDEPASALLERIRAERAAAQSSKLRAQRPRRARATRAGVAP